MSTVDPLPKAVPPPPTEKVTANEVLESVGDGTVQKLTGQQWAALVLAAAVFFLVVGATVFNFFILESGLPALPVPPVAKDVEQYKQLVDHYTELTNAAHERSRNLFETFVAAAFLPLFAGIVGFIFGRERAG